MKKAKKIKIEPNLMINSISNTHIACAGFSSSSNDRGEKYTLSFVGTTNKDQTKVFSNCRYGLRKKDWMPNSEY